MASKALRRLKFWQETTTENALFRYRFGYRFMPKPLFLPRPAGLYVRFLVPQDLRALVGSRFVVRRLQQSYGDDARLTAAAMGVALSKAFRHLRQGDVVDLKKALDAAKFRHDLILGVVELPNGTIFRDVRVDTPEDERQLKSLMEASLGQGLPSPKPVVSSHDMLTEQIKTHLSDLERAGRDPKTILDSRHTLRLFVGLVGDKPVREISSDNCRTFLDGVQYWPKNATKRPEFANLSISKIIRKSKASNEVRPAQHTLNKYRQRLSVFFHFLLSNQKIDRNPLLGIARPAKFDVDDETGRAFTQDELDKIFEPNTFKNWAGGHPHRWWAPLIGLHTGARVTEICQLYVDDIATEHGVAGFHIRKTHPDQKLKTRAALRFIPIAKALLDAGFLEYVSDVQNAGHKRLFPHLPNNDGTGFGRQMSRRFSSYIKDRGVLDPGMGFHAFRHTMSTRLDRAKVPHGTIAKITGHQVAGGVLPKFYIDAPTLLERVDAIEHFQSGMTLPMYEKGQFDVALKEALSLPRKWKSETEKRSRKFQEGKRSKSRSDAK
jgi:integrase